MAREGDPRASLNEGLRSLAADHAPGLIADAEEIALERARERLSEEMLKALLEAAAETLAERGRPERRSSPEAAEAPPPAATPEWPGHYVYGVVEGDAALPEGLEGVEPSDPPWLLPDGDLAAIVSRVSLAEFGEESLRENLNDVEWLERKARGHEGVLDAALDVATVVPLRLCTIYAGEDQVREMLRRERLVLRDALDRLAGKAEWGVKAIAAPGVLERAALERLDAEPAAGGASAGMEYLNRKRTQGKAREIAEEVADEWAREIHEPLAALATEALLNPLQNPEVSGHEGDMLLNGVYLVEESEVERFRALADELRQRHRPAGVGVELTGPWPAYNFVKGSIEAAR